MLSLSLCNSRGKLREALGLEVSTRAACIFRQIWPIFLQGTPNGAPKAAAH